MYTREELGAHFGPYQVQIADYNLSLKDGTLIAMRFWFPGSKLPFETNWDVYCQESKSNETLEETFPTVMEYLPYCKGTYTKERDHLRHPWLASQGFVIVRPDMRGTGDSEGLYFDEYESQEQQDAMEIIEWISNQSWSNGRVGMYGKSWGGFNGLQVAFHQPPALKAVISLYSTDNRYTDDIHWKGGSLVASQMLSWASIMFAWNARPPHPESYAGTDWKETWKTRLEKASRPWTKIWMEHQTYDDYWKQGSIQEKYSQVQIPILAIGGWHDMYSNAVFRLVENLPNCRGIIGPWSHDWPDVSTPGPQIGFMSECLDFWNHHLKDGHGQPSEKQVKAPKLIWYQCQGSLSPIPHIKTWPGKWCATRSQNTQSDAVFKYYLNEGHLLDQQDFCGTQKEWKIEYDPNSGWTSGEMLSFGGPDLPAEQSYFNSPRTTWKSQRLQRDLDLFGFPEFNCQFQIHNDTQGALIVKLCDEFPDGQTRLISFGVMNLTHYKSHEKPEQLRTGTWYDLRIQLDALGYEMLQGHKIVLHICCSYWPMIWTPRRETSLRIRGAHLSLPILQDLPEASPDILCSEPYFGPALDVEEIEKSSYSRWLNYGLSTNVSSIEIEEKDGLKRHVDSNITFGETTKSSYQLSKEDPLTAKALCKHHLKMKFGNTKSLILLSEENEGNVDTEIFTESEMSADLDNFHLKESLRVQLNNETFFEKSWESTIPRIFV